MRDVQAFQGMLNRLKDAGVVSGQKRFYTILPMIEEAFSAGIKHPAILQELNQNGFDLNMPTYRVMLKRARKQHAEASGKSQGKAISAAPQENNRQRPVPEARRQIDEPLRQVMPKLLDHDLTKLPKW